MKQNNSLVSNAIRYFTAILFVFLFISYTWNIWLWLWGGISLHSITNVIWLISVLSSCIGDLLIFISLLSKNKGLAVAGCILLAVGTAASFIPSLIKDGLSRRWDSNLRNFGIPFLFLLGYLLSGFSCMSKPRQSVGLAFASAVILLAACIIQRLVSHSSDIAIDATIRTLPEATKYASPFFLLCMTFADLRSTPLPVQQGQPVQQDTMNHIEKLTKLKEMLDKGILTPEEFEAKKKQLLEG